MRGIIYLDIIKLAKKSKNFVPRSTLGRAKLVGFELLRVKSTT